MSQTRSSLLVGGGVIGLATAEALLLSGSQVTIVELGEVGRESSWAGGGILSPLCPWDYPDDVTQLSRLGAAMYQQWTSDLNAVTAIDTEYATCGMLVKLLGDHAVAKQWCDTHGVRSEPKGDDLLLPDIAQVRNPRLVQSLRKRVELLGGRIIEHCKVTSIAAEADQVKCLATTQGDFYADRYIVTAGAWSKQLLGQHALNLDIKPIRGQMLLFKFDTPPLQHIVLQDGMYLIPRRDGHLLVGSTLEDVGFDKSTTLEARDSLWRRAALLLPALHDMPLVQHWSGLRPASPRNIPTIGRHPHLENLYINSGHFRYGVTMAPASVEILMNELNGAPQPFDVTPYQAGWGLADT